MDNRSEDHLHMGEAWELGPSESSSIHELPRADGGKDAWLFLAAAFMVETLVWGESGMS